MEREGLSGREAFDRLREVSNRHDVKLRDLARVVIEVGELPD